MTPIRILLVDDTPAFTQALRRYLHGPQLEVVGVATSAREALGEITRLQPDLVLMDIRLRGLMDGVEATEKIRQVSDVPVVFLTAHSDSRTLERAQLTEPFGYILKPFNPREMVARVERVLRRIGDFAYTLDPLIRVDDRLSVDFAHQKALVEGTAVPLTSTESKLLYVLMRQAGRVVPTEFLMRRLWPVEEAFEDTLRKAARSCRVELQVLERGSADFDHPVPLGFAEGEYLIWTLSRVLA